MTSATNDTVEIIGAVATPGGGISIIVSTSGTLGGTYTCPFDGGSVVELTYHLMTPTVESCSVMIGFTTDAEGHEHVTGTFEATLTFQDAGMTMLTAGVIDIPDMRMGG
jgi:disulfide bond formation protein DsbB